MFDDFDVFIQSDEFMDEYSEWLALLEDDYSNGSLVETV